MAPPGSSSDFASPENLSLSLELFVIRMLFSPLTVEAVEVAENCNSELSRPCSNLLSINFGWSAENEEIDVNEYWSYIAAGCAE